MSSAAVARKPQSSSGITGRKGERQREREKEREREREREKGREKGRGVNRVLSTAHFKRIGGR